HGAQRLYSLSHLSRQVLSLPDPKRICSAHMIGKMLGLLLHLFSLVPEGRSDPAEHVLPGSAVMEGPRREVRSPVKGLGLRRQEHIQRPAATPGHGLDGIHINMVQVGPFFPVDLDIDKMLIHEPGGRGILETFSFHHMTPMTSRISYAHQYGLVLRPGL